MTSAGPYHDGYLAGLDAAADMLRNVGGASKHYDDAVGWLRELRAKSVLPAPSVAIELPLRLVNSANGSHGHWGGKAERAKDHREAVALALPGPLMRAGIVKRKVGLAKTSPSGRQRCAHVELVPEHLYVRITRLAPSGGLDEHDGLRNSAKAVTDAVTWELGLVNDRDARVRWLYDQRPSGKRGLYGVRIEILKPIGETP